MNADHPQHDTPDPDQRPTDQQQDRQELLRHPFWKAWETWNAWSMADTMRQAHKRAHQQADHDTLATFERYPQWTQGPSALEALDANRELVDDLTGWRWLAIRDARQQGHGWQEIGQTLRQSAEQAKASYLARVHGQRRLAQEIPSLGYDPHWLELAEPNDADRATDRPTPQPPRPDGH
jgi:hypothetical protein